MIIRKIDTENVIVVAFLKRTKCYNFSVNSTLVFSVPEFIFNKFPLWFFVKVAYRVFCSKPLKIV